MLAEAQPMPPPGAPYAHGDIPPTMPVAPAVAAFGNAPTRDAWLAECHRRSAPVEIIDESGWDSRHRHTRAKPERTGPDSCEAYLLNYEAWVQSVSAGYAAQSRIFVPARNSCCQNAEVARRPDCHETVEYVEETVRAPRAIRRAPRMHDKRIRIAPDKRARVD